MPGYVAALVGGDGALDIGAGQLGDDHVQHVGHGGLTGAGLDILGVHLGAHAVLVEDVTQGHGVGQVHVHAGGRRGRRGHGGQADVGLVDAHPGGEDGVDAVLHHQLGHDLPGLPGGGVGVVGAVDLSHTGPGDQLLAFAGVHEGADHVDVAVDDIVLGILMDAVDALLGEHDGDVGAGDAGDIAVVVDGTAHLILDHVQRLALGADLLAGDGHTAHALGRTLDQSVEVALAGGTDDHDVVGAMVGSHAHTADVVLKAAGGDLGGDHGAGLGVDVTEIVGGRQGHAGLQGLGAVMVLKGTHVQVGHRLAPGPAPAAGTVGFQILQDFSHIDGLVGLQLVVAHSSFPPSNSFSACSQSLPSDRATPAWRSSMFSVLDRR